MQEIRGKGRECTNNKWPKHLVTRYVSRYCPEEKTAKKTARFIRRYWGRSDLPPEPRPVVWSAHPAQ